MMQASQTARMKINPRRLKGALDALCGFRTKLGHHLRWREPDSQYDAERHDEAIVEIADTMSRFSDFARILALDISCVANLPESNSQ